MTAAVANLHPGSRFKAKLKVELQSPSLSNLQTKQHTGWQPCHVKKKRNCQRPCRNQTCLSCLSLVYVFHVFSPKQQTLKDPEQVCTALLQHGHKLCPLVCSSCRAVVWRPLQSQAGGGNPVCQVYLNCRHHSMQGGKSVV